MEVILISIVIIAFIGIPWLRKKRIEENDDS